MTEQKQCTACKKFKSINEFNKAGKDKHSYCRPCHQACHQAMTIAAHQVGLSRRAWVKNIPLKERYATHKVIFEGLLQKLETDPLLEEIAKIEAISKDSEAINPILQRIRSLHVAEKSTKPKSQQTQIEEGFVYVITNPAWPEAVKIGKALDYELREAQFQTGCPYRDYKICYEQHFENRLIAEQTAHKIANAKHISGDWFKMSVEEAKELIVNMNL